MWKSFRLVTTRALARLVGALFGVLLLASCGGSSSDVATSAPVDAGESASASLLTGDFPTVQGGQIDLASLEGQDVVLWFWAPW